MCFCSSDFFLFTFSRLNKILLYFDFDENLFSMRSSFGSKHFFRFFGDFSRRWKKAPIFFRWWRTFDRLRMVPTKKKNGRGQKCEKSKSGKIWPKVRSNFFSPIAVFLLHIVSQKAIVWSSTSRPKIGETFHWRQGFLERIKNSWFFSPIQIQTLEKNKRKSLPGVV